MTKNITLTTTSKFRPRAHQAGVYPGYFSMKRRKVLHFLAKNDNTSAIADHVKATGHNIKWDHFDILAKGKTDYNCKIKETLYIQELEPAFNVNVGSEKLILY